MTLGRLLWCGGLLFSLASTLCFAQSKKGAASSPAATTAGTPAAATPAATSNAAFESQMLALAALDKIGAYIASNSCELIKPSPPTQSPSVQSNATPDGKSEAENKHYTVLIYDQTSFASLQAYEAFLENAAFLESSYATLIVTAQAGTRIEMHTESLTGTTSTSAPAVNNAITTYLPLITPLLSAMAVASNTESSAPIAFPDSAIAAIIMRDFNQKVSPGCTNVDISYPALFGAGSATASASDEVRETLDELNSKRATAHANVLGQFSKCVAPAAGAADPKAPSDTKPATSPTCPADTARAAALTDIDTLYDNFMNGLIQANAITGVMGSATVIQGQQLAKELKVKKDTAKKAGESTVVLAATILSAGGTQHVHKTFWTALSSGDKISYSGGAAVQVLLWRMDEQSAVWSDVLRYETPFKEIAEPRGGSVGVDEGSNFPPPPVQAPPGQSAQSQGQPKH